jgi:hypothetical protein
MNYDLIIYEIRNPNAYTILAHQLARNPEITLQKASKMLEKLPLTLFKQIDESSMHTYLAQYSHHGIILKALPSDVSIKENDNDNRTSGLNRAAHGYRVEDKKQAIRGMCSNGVSNQVLLELKNGMRELKPKKKQIKPALLASLFLLAAMLIGLIVLLLNNNKIVYRYARLGKSIISSNQVVSRQKISSIHIINKKIEERKRVSTEQKITSEKMVDSANIVSSDLRRMINFYKIAISFNRFNANAWLGLLSTYKSAGMDIHYQQCLKNMEEIFGDQVFVTSSVVEKYGKITDSYVSEDSILRITYKSEVKREDTLLYDIYMMIRTLEAQSNFNGISVSSIDSENKEIIVHARPGMRIETFDSFKKNASINIFK